MDQSNSATKTGNAILITQYLGHLPFPQGKSLLFTFHLFGNNNWEKKTERYTAAYLELRGTFMINVMFSLPEQSLCHTFYVKTAVYVVHCNFVLHRDQTSLHG